ncbi:uncharacterized protein LY79DRAFT_674241 [Colletotrichum navitas]|uniref:Uncharacterized protein n=1 Tax=Colletotrichum navitas TaxID=681940 RepID=A0AAD8UZM7_9PEZI|nr:uncharacterized protein LY79DRAFT_674241 [Colletotrichum navitas]KAK1570093.1 hypothetical protein LY79DRAFT_674241 [Colletotrichum navitas]
MAKEDERFWVQQEADAKKLLDKMDEHLTDAKESYKKARDLMLMGMDLVGGAILMGLAEATGTALNKFAGSMNPVGSVGEASKGLSSLAKDLKAETKSTPTTTATLTTDTSGNSSTTAVATTNLGGEANETSQKQKAESKKKLLTSKLAATFIREAKSKTDEATKSNIKPEPTKQATETTSRSSSGYGEYDLSVEVIKIIFGLPKGINWDLVTSSDTNKASELVTASHALSRILKSFKPRKGGLASQLLIVTVAETIGVAEELEAEGAKSTQLSKWEKPTRQSAVYKDWDNCITRCSTNAIALDAALQAVPGGVGTHGVSLTTPQQTPEEKIANMNCKQSIAEQNVKSATQKLTSTQETYKATLDTYRKTADNLKDVKETLQAACAEIAALDAKKLDRIRKLVVFFGNLTAMIDMSNDAFFNQQRQILSEYNTNAEEMVHKIV